MPYSLLILLRERRRFFPAILSVAFSAMLIAIQCGLLMGLLLYSSLPIDNTTADIWITTNDSPSIALGQPIPESWLLDLQKQEEVQRAEPFLSGVTPWKKPHSGSLELCCIFGSYLDDGAMGALRQLTPRTRKLLSEPGTVVVDEGDLEKLGLKRGVGEVAEIGQHQVRVVDLVHGFQAMTAPYVFCSLRTARMLLPIFQQQPYLMSYGLARCRSPQEVPALVARLRATYPEMGVYSSEEFSRRTQLYWLFRSKAGTSMICTVILALLVGVVVTSQTLYSATIASLREYAVLTAMGIPTWRLMGLVMSQSFWIGLLGVVLALPTSLALSQAATFLETKVVLPEWLLGMTAGLTMLMALFSGTASLRSLRLVEVAMLLR